jgi:hypothetical protein
MVEVFQWGFELILFCVRVFAIIFAGGAVVYLIFRLASSAVYQSKFEYLRRCLRGKTKEK